MSWLSKRFDGTARTDLSPTRRIMPFIMPTRTGASVFFEHRLDVRTTLQWIQDNRANPNTPNYSFFEIVLAATVRTLHERPGLNRYIVGSRIFQRSNVALAFSVKSKRTDAAKLSTVKRTFPTQATLHDIHNASRDAIQEGRSDTPNTAERESSAFLKLPTPLLRLAIRLQSTLDRWNLLPASLLEPDPLYSSVFLANLGSIGLDAPYHHLYEYGTVPLFIALGTLKKGVLVDQETSEIFACDVIDIKYTLDERIHDGFYCARSLEVFHHLIQNPDLLCTPPAPLQG